jgi:phosphatidylglycerol:prolipoprotein diacylglycerol transferase
MYPVVAGYSTIFLAWWLAAIVGTIISLTLATRDGHAAGRSLLAFVTIGVVFVLGTKLHFWLANPELVAGLGIQNLLGYGFHIPGGIILSAVVVPPLLHALRLSPLALLDSTAPGIGFAILVARLGCFCNGCCFGYVSGGPWAIRFPAGSRAHEHHLVLELIPPDAPYSLPVLPLNLYFSAVGLAIGVALSAWRPRRRFVGQLTLGFVALWSASNAVIEYSRDPRMVPGAPHLWEISVAIAAIAVPVLAVLSYRYRDRRAPLP